MQGVRLRMKLHSIKLAVIVLAFPIMISAHAFDIQGHRGARGLAPENTLEGFAAALSIGVSTLELDTGITRDGVVIIAHDTRLNPDVARGPDGRWLNPPTHAIHELSFHELQRYDVGRLRPGSDYSRRFPQQRRMDRVRIPTLASLFELVRRSGNAQVRFNIETKLSPIAPAETASPEAFVAALLAVIREQGMEARVTVQSFDWRTLRLVQQQAPAIETSYLSAQQSWTDNILMERDAAKPSPWTAGIAWADHGSVPKMVKAAGGAVWSPYFAELTPQSVKEAQALGLKVLPWTVNETADMERMIGLGVDGMISDYPDRLRDILQTRGLALPAATPAAAPR